MAKKLWALFFLFWPIVAVIFCAMAPSMGWWFPSETAQSVLGLEIDGLFYLILAIVTIVFIGTQAGLFYVLWQGASKTDESKAHFSHGSHSLEIIWTIVPAFVLVFIALYQMDVWADFRVQSRFPEETQREGAVAEVMARQFEWRIRYPGIGEELQDLPAENDLYYVNEVHVPTAKPVKVNLRTQDVQHAFFAPELRLKQDAVPGLIIPVWFEIPKAGEYTLLCAELCGWGHYKMRANIVAESQEQVDAYLLKLRDEQNSDGTVEEVE